jgi:hypothetical protein
VSTKIDLKKVLEEAEQHKGLPPVHLWQPELSGDIDIVIKRDGQWWHEGSPFERLALVKLFASILRREEDGDYYLVTPVEKWRIQVEDLPLMMVTQDIEHEGGVDQTIKLVSNLGDVITVDDAHPIEVTLAGDGQPQPAIAVRNGLAARLSRPVYYQLVNLAEERQVDGQAVYGVKSGGVFFPLQ